MDILIIELRAANKTTTQRQIYSLTSIHIRSFEEPLYLLYEAALAGCYFEPRERIHVEAFPWAIHNGLYAPLSLEVYCPFGLARKVLVEYYDCPLLLVSTLYKVCKLGYVPVLTQHKSVRICFVY